MSGKTVVVTSVESVDTEENEVTWKFTKEDVPAAGLPVNLVIGQTGTGKTSLIQMCAGGSPKTGKSALVSDTKEPSLYKLMHNGETHMLMDTVGLGDTASNNDERKVFIQDMVKYIQQNNLNVCRVYFTMAMDGRLMQEMLDWMPTLVDALGGKDTVSLIGNWVITKWNLDSRMNKKLCQKDADSEEGIYQTLGKHTLGFAVVRHGEDNLDEFFKSMVNTKSRMKGLSKNQMSDKAQNHEMLQAKVDTLQEAVDENRTALSSLKTDQDFMDAQSRLESRLAKAKTDLSNCGKSKSEKRKYSDLIASIGRQLDQSKIDWKDNNTTKEDKMKKLDEMNKSFQDELAALKKREGLMGMFATLVGAKEDKAVDLVKGK